MNNLLDTIASLPAWFMAIFFTLLPFILLPLSLWLARMNSVRLEKLSKQTRVPEGLLFLIPILGLWLILFLWVSQYLPLNGYGFTSKVESLDRFEDILIVKDTIYTAGADGDGTPVERLHVIELNSGKELQRLIVEKPYTLKEDKETTGVSPGSFKNEEFMLVGYSRQQILKNGKQINPALNFLNGRILHVAENGQYIFILSFELLDLTTPQITCVSSKGEFIWKRDLQAFDGKPNFPKKPNQYHSLLYNKFLVVEANGRIFAFDTKDGELLWRVRI